MKTEQGSGVSVNIQLTKEASVQVAVMASAWSPGGSSAHCSWAWPVVIDEAIDHPSCRLILGLLGEPTALCSFPLMSSLLHVHIRPSK